MLFIRRESFKQYLTWYPVTSLLIALNLAVFLLMELAGSSRSTATLIEFGAMFHAPGGPSPEPWRYVTSMFLHIGFEHLLFNSFALYVFAPALERILGKLRYILLYLLSGIAGSGLSQALDTGYSVSAGASGAIYGIYASLLYIALFRKDIIDQQNKQTILVLIGVGFLYSIIMPKVSLLAHLGGFIGGLIITALIIFSVKRRQ